MIVAACVGDGSSLFSSSQIHNDSRQAIVFLIFHLAADCKSLPTALKEKVRVIISQVSKGKTSSIKGVIGQRRRDGVVAAGQ